jgi:hypothetical protein
MQWFPLAFCMIVFRHTVGLLWTSDQPVAETSTCTGQHNIETQQTKFHAPSWIRNRDPGNQAAADLRLRPRCHWDRRTNKLNIIIHPVGPVLNPRLSEMLPAVRRDSGVDRLDNSNLGGEGYQKRIWLREGEEENYI